MIDSNIRQAVNDIMDVIRDKYIPGNEIAQYYECDIALQDYVAADLLEYYGELEKLQLANYGVTAAIILLPKNKNIVPLNSQTKDYLDVLNEDEFADSGFSMPVQTVEGKYLYYPIQTGDTMYRIAQKIYGNYKLYTYIEQENNVRNNDLIDRDMTGYILRIPILEEQQLKDENNLVYSVFENTNEGMKKYYLGQDVYLHAGRMEADMRGDIRITEPIEGVVQNIEDRINHVQGSLNPMNPEWGVESIANYTGIPYSVAVKKFYDSVQEQIKSDPRVGDVKLNREKTRIVGDALYIAIDITFITGDNDTVTTRVQ